MPQLILAGNFRGTDLQYIIMEKLGYNLKQLLRKNTKHKFTLKTVVQIGIQLIQNLQNLHEKGYLHSDLKPENILIGSNELDSPASSIVYLVDFGVS